MQIIIRLPELPGLTLSRKPGAVHGVLQADAFAGYDRLFSAERNDGPLTEAACWAHARSKIHGVYTTTAEEALCYYSDDGLAEADNNAV